MKPRWYQDECSDVLVDFLERNPDKHPIAAIPTAGGKTFIGSLFVDKYLSKYPTSNILILSHIKEILEQDHDALSDYFDIDIGLYSAGLDSKTIKKITVAGIQSIWRSPHKFKDFDIIIIDECHLVTIVESGMYRKFLSKIKAQYIGLTATPFRLGHGYIYEGEGALFTDLAYDLTSRDNFNRLVDEGYLSKLITKATLMKMDTDKIKIRAGDFALNDLSKTFDRIDITNLAIDEILQFGKNYKKWMIFAIDIEHAEHIAAALNYRGIKTICVHSGIDFDRSKAIDDFKAGEYRAIVNVEILTTGFDEPGIDLVAILRPTKSPVIHVQTIGRGLRIADGKDHCLVLDFAGNTERLGPINDVQVKTKGKGDGSGDPITKRCPDCDVIHHPTVKVCDVCGHVFVFKEKLRAEASTEAIVRQDIIEWVDVDDVTYSIHQKMGKPNSLLVKYKCGLITFKEWVCLEHKGYAKYKAQNWVRFRLVGQKELPKSVADLYQNVHKLKVPSKIKVNTSKKIPAIEDSVF